MYSDNRALIRLRNRSSFCSRFNFITPKHRDNRLHLWTAKSRKQSVQKTGVKSNKNILQDNSRWWCYSESPQFKLLSLWERSRVHRRNGIIQSVLGWLKIRKISIWRYRFISRPQANWLHSTQNIKPRRLIFVEGAIR